MNYIQLLTTALSIAVSQSGTFRVGNFNVSVSNNGAPVRLTFAQALLVVEEVATRTAGTFQVGSILVTVSPR